MLPVRFSTRFCGPLIRPALFDSLDDLDRLAGSFFEGGRRGPLVNVDVREDEGHYYVDADVPGFERDDIDVTLEDGVLTVSGERKRTETREGESFHVIERRHGRFTRSFRLSDNVKDEGIEASMKDGVLTVKLAKADEIKPRRIEVRTG